jgi:glutathione S-transferase
MPLRVYRIPFSTNVERVALAAGHKSLAVEWVDVHPDDRSALEQISGQALVPVLVDGDEVVCDSPVIVDLLDQRYPEPPLYPADEARRAEVELFVDWFNRLWKRPPNLITDELLKPEPDQALIDGWSAELAGALDRFESLLAGRDYLFGDFGAADVIAFPFLKYPVLGLPDGDDHVFHRVLVERMPVGERHPRLSAWVRRVDEHPRA